MPAERLQVFIEESLDALRVGEHEGSTCDERELLELFKACAVRCLYTNYGIVHKSISEEFALTFRPKIIYDDREKKTIAQQIYQCSETYDQRQERHLKAGVDNIYCDGCGKLLWNLRYDSDKIRFGKLIPIGNGAYKCGNWGCGEDESASEPESSDDEDDDDEEEEEEEPASSTAAASRGKRAGGGAGKGDDEGRPAKKLRKQASDDDLE